jgi:hypothetical protein
MASGKTPRERHPGRSDEPSDGTPIDGAPVEESPVVDSVISEASTPEAPRRSRGESASRRVAAAANAAGAAAAAAGAAATAAGAAATAAGAAATAVSEQLSLESDERAAAETTRRPRAATPKASAHRAAPSSDTASRRVSAAAAAAGAAATGPAAGAAPDTKVALAAGSDTDNAVAAASAAAAAAVAAVSAAIAAAAVTKAQASVPIPQASLASAPASAVVESTAPAAAAVEPVSQLGFSAATIEKPATEPSTPVDLPPLSVAFNRKFAHWEVLPEVPGITRAGTLPIDETPIDEKPVDEKPIDAGPTPPPALDDDLPQVVGITRAAHVPADEAKPDVAPLFSNEGMIREAFQHQPTLKDRLVGPPAAAAAWFALTGKALGHNLGPRFVAARTFAGTIPERLSGTPGPDGTKAGGTIDRIRDSRFAAGAAVVLLAVWAGIAWAARVAIIPLVAHIGRAVMWPYRRLSGPRDVALDVRRWPGAQPEPVEQRRRRIPVFLGLLGGLYGILMCYIVIAGLILPAISTGHSDASPTANYAAGTPSASASISSSAIDSGLAVIPITIPTTSATPTPTPTPKPTVKPTAKPTAKPKPKPTAQPTPTPMFATIVVPIPDSLHGVAPTIRIRTLPGSKCQLYRSGSTATSGPLAAADSAGYAVSSSWTVTNRGVNTYTIYATCTSPAGKAVTSATATLKKT